MKAVSVKGCGDNFTPNQIFMAVQYQCFIFHVCHVAGPKFNMMTLLHERQEKKEKLVKANRENDVKFFSL